MSLVTKSQLNFVIKSLKALISFKADRDEVRIKLDKSEVSDEKAIKIAAETGLVTPLSSDNNALYTDEKGAIFIL